MERCENQTTFDALTGYMIEYKVVNPGENQYTKRLPMGVTHIKTIFRYEDTVTVYIVYYVESAHQNIDAHQNQARTKIKTRAHQV